jgi:hypothetical protein
MSEKRKAGQPSKFEDYKDFIINMAKYGLTDKQMADVLNITDTTINNWKLKHEAFFESLKASKLLADMEIQDSLFKKAKGHKTTIQKAFKVKQVTYDNGKRLIEKEEIITAADEVYTPPDTTAIIFWLKNRQPKDWRDKQEIEHSGNMAVQIIDDIK